MNTAKLPKRYAAYMAIIIAVPVAVWAEVAVENPGARVHVSVDAEEAKASIVIENKGANRVSVKKLTPSCGCTTATIDRDSLDPHEKATISALVKIGDHSGPTTKFVSVETDDIVATPLDCAVALDIDSPLAPSSNEVTWRLGGNAAKTQVVTLKPSVSGEVVVNEIKPLDPAFGAELKRIEGQNSFELDITAFDTSRACHGAIEISVAWTTEKGRQVSKRMKIGAIIR